MSLQFAIFRNMNLACILWNYVCFSIACQLVGSFFSILSRHSYPQNYLSFGYFVPYWSFWFWLKALETISSTPIAPRIPKRYSFTIFWQTTYQDFKNPPSYVFLDILDLPEYSNDDKKPKNLFNSIFMIPRFPKRYHM